MLTQGILVRICATPHASNSRISNEPLEQNRCGKLGGTPVTFHRATQLDGSVRGCTICVVHGDALVSTLSSGVALRFCSSFTLSLNSQNSPHRRLARRSHQVIKPRGLNVERHMMFKLEKTQSLHAPSVLKTCWVMPPCSEIPEHWCGLLKLLAKARYRLCLVQRGGRKRAISGMCFAGEQAYCIVSC